jgi:hypothetical protein
LPDDPADNRLPPLGFVPAAYQPALFPPGSAAPTAKEIPGGETLPDWPEVNDEKQRALPAEGGFAIDRVQPALPQRIERHPLQQVALEPVPALPDRATLARQGAPPMPTMRPMGDDYPLGNPYPYPGNRDPYAGSDDGSAQAGPVHSTFYVSADYLLWWTKKDQTPPLVSTSTDGTGFGFLGQPNTVVLFGGDLGRDPRSGFRGNAGIWLDNCCGTAVEVGGFFLGSRSTNFEADSGPNGVLSRPFFNVNTGSEFAQLVAFPGISTGRVTVSAPSNLWGLDTNLRCNLCCGCCYRFDLLGGFRFLDLNESITITEQIQGGAGAPAPFTNAQTTVFDRFATRNNFYGGQIGFDGEWKRGRWSVDVQGKLALGATDERIDINGMETITDATGTTRTFNGGLLALSSNIGSFHKTQFSVVPELGVTLGYQLTETVRVYAGYNILYWTRVARPGDQIDRNIDVTKIPNFTVAGVTPTGQNVPAVPFKQTDYWAQGLVLGFEIRY